jgi:pyroglutamyl-peptidase
MTTILLTGFGPFPGAPFNPSAALAQRLATFRHPRLAGTRRIAHVFRTSYAAVDEDLPQLIARHRPDLILMFGLAARTPYLRVEMRARNAVSSLLSDFTGKRTPAHAIRAGSPHAINGQGPFQKLLIAGRKTRVPIRLSRNAGRYVCNYLYWRALETKPQRGRHPLVLFVHVPWLSRTALPERRGKANLLTGIDLFRAGQAILLAALPEARARH